MAQPESPCAATRKIPHDVAKIPSAAAKTQGGQEGSKDRSCVHNLGEQDYNFQSEGNSINLSWRNLEWLMKVDLWAEFDGSFSKI